MFMKIAKKIPIDRNIPSKFRREETTEYPVEKLFFLGSKVLYIHKIPKKSEREIEIIAKENFVSIIEKMKNIV